MKFILVGLVFVIELSAGFSEAAPMKGSSLEVQIGTAWEKYELSKGNGSSIVFSTPTSSETHILSPEDAAYLNGLFASLPKAAALPNNCRRAQIRVQHAGRDRSWCALGSAANSFSELRRSLRMALLKSRPAATQPPSANR